MDWEKIRKIEKEDQRVNAIYQIYQEDSRLNRSKGARVEFLTTMKYIHKYAPPGCKILDIGAGAGEYSLSLAEKGYQVTAVELTDRNIEAFKKKIMPDWPIGLLQGNALDLSVFQDESFDVVLLMGPLYHLEDPANQQQAIKEAKRVCKKDGVIFFTFICGDMVILTELMYQPDFFSENTYHHDTFKVENFPFVFVTVEEAREILKKGEIHTLHEVAVDGVSELMEDKINNLSEEDYHQYLRYHEYCCEKPEMLGRSNHLLFIGKKA